MLARVLRPLAAVTALVTLWACNGTRDGGSGIEMELSKATLTATFDGVAPGAMPPDWRAAATGDGVPGRWEVVRDQTAPSQPSALALTSFPDGPNPTYNVCFADWVPFRDGRLSVRMKAVSGVIDQGGGPMWRVQGPDDYYVCRANPLEGNFRLYEVVGGKRRQIASADVDVPAGTWHLIEVEHVRDRIVCTLNGTTRIEAVSRALDDEGGIGVWTKADAVTSFDDLTAAPTER